MFLGSFLPTRFGEDPKFFIAMFYALCHYFRLLPITHGLFLYKILKHFLHERPIFPSSERPEKQDCHISRPPFQKDQTNEKDSKLLA